jgi:hypothetical protein
MAISSMQRSLRTAHHKNLLSRGGSVAWLDLPGFLRLGKNSATSQHEAEYKDDFCSA